MAEVDCEDIELRRQLRAAGAVITQQHNEIERLREQVKYRDDVISMLRADVARLEARGG